MDDGELDISNQLLMSNSDLSNNIEEFLRNIKTCAHTQVLSASEGEREEEVKRPRKPLGNREAVRRYREKKKAHTAYLEEEVKKLRLVNQHLTRKLQGQAALEAEVVRLRSLLVDLRAKIDGELGVCLCKKQCSEIGKILGWDIDHQTSPNNEDSRHNLAAAASLEE
ncbi:uncharacterized protein A4U43_C02F19110 [Asparagus officinalis]|uniref:BZIP domain-containing protein n=1 Tax=Asparagus officinalis TaxID=4686 RepID=A0A5P1FPA2_ASPOF|nr:basic leucine zipper 23-like [Asparagus officinalis]ONK78470.1 uncharacterized protein A4U43_C02F19110 [Asparagus officinalis]